MTSIETLDMKNGALAYLDILGFKGIWQRETVQKVIAIMNGVETLVKDTYRESPSDKGWNVRSEPFVTILSDTIVIGYEAEENPSCLFLLCNMVYNLIHSFLNYGLFLRGAITYGRYIRERNTFIGPAVDDVAEWYEVPDMIGVVTTPKCNYQIDRYNPFIMLVKNLSVQAYIKYDVPDKNNKIHHLNIFNWPGYLQASFDKLSEPNEKSDARRLIEKIFSQQEAFGAEVLRKYENTLSFIDYGVTKVMPLQSK